MIRSALPSALLSVLLLGSAAVARAADAPPGPVTVTIPKPTFATDFGLVLPNQVLTVTVVAAPDYALDSGAVDKASGWMGAPYTWTFVVPASYAGAHVATFTGKYHPTGGKEGSPQLLDWSGTATAKGIAVTIGDVVRGAGLPRSVPPGITRDVAVTIDPSPLPGHSVVLTIDNGGDAAAGSAVITAPAGGALTSSGTITIRGGTQTVPKHSGKLTIAAYLDTATGAVLARSTGFSVCAHIVDFRLAGMNRDLHDDRGYYGMIVNMDWSSDDDKNTRAMLDRCWWLEKVATPVQNDPPWTPVRLDVQNNAARGNSPSAYDKHYYPRANLQGAPPTVAGHVTRTQEYDFYCERCGMTKAGMVKIPGADFQIDLACVANDVGEYHVSSVKTGPGGPVASSIQYQWVPIAPADVAGTITIDPVDPGNFTVTITWKDRSDIEKDYKATFEVDQEEESPSLAAGSTSYTSRAFPLAGHRGKQVKLTVRARNEVGASPRATATITVPQ